MERRELPDSFPPLRSSATKAHFEVHVSSTQAKPQRRSHRGINTFHSIIIQRIVFHTYTGLELYIAAKVVDPEGLG